MGLRQERFASGLAKAPTALMWSTIIVFDQPGIEIGLKLVECAIDLLAKRDPVELVEHSAMKALADSIIRHDDFDAPVSAASSAKRVW